MCFKGDYKKCWENDGNDDSLDEMTVIIGSNRKISDAEVFFIRETTFLQDFYEDRTIISWSHDSAHEYEFYKERMNVLLKPEYVDCVLKALYLSRPVLSNIFQSDNGAEVILFEGRRTDMKNVIQQVATEVKKDLSRPQITRLKRRNSSIFQFITYPIFNGVKLLPIVSSVPKSTLAIKGYTIIDVPADGNCAFTAVKVAQGEDELFKGKIGIKLTSQQVGAIQDLRNTMADEMGKIVHERSDFIQALHQPGFWNSGIDGAVGIEVLSFVAQIVGRPILVLTQELDGRFRYWISGTTENPRDGNLIFYDIDEKHIEHLLNANPSTIKLFHNGIHFQAIVRGESSLSPSRPAFSPAPTPATTDTSSTVKQATDSASVESGLTAAGYHIQDVPGDGN